MEEESESRINFISCVKWVKKGVARTNPEKIQLSKQELVQVIKDTQDKLRLTANETDQGTSQDENYQFENYDDDEDTGQTLGISSLAELNNDIEENFSESDDSDKEDEIIRPGDNLILAGHVDGDASYLDVYVYNGEEEALYVHHDLILPAFPLCLEWLNYEHNAPKGNYCAIGSMTPIIQIWDLDFINCIEPAYVLGHSKSTKKNRPHVGHTDAVLALAWNQQFEHCLASGSVDKSILLWDLENKTPTTTIKAFKDKIQCMQWHHFEAHNLLAGSSDKKVKVFDCRNPDSHHTWKLDGEIESLAWNPLQPFMFFAGTDKGTLQAFDCRQGKLWSVEAHEQEVTGLMVSGRVPGLLITSSPDGALKTWDYTEAGANCVCEKDFNVGSVHCLDLSSDSPFVIAIGGDNKSNNFAVYDLRNNESVEHQFGTRQLVELVQPTENQTTENMQ